MLCANQLRGNDLPLCFDEDARLWVGTSSLTGLRALFTDLATGRETLVYAIEDTDEWYIDALDFFIPGHTYTVQLVANATTPVDFYPYTFNGSTYEASTDTTGAVVFTVQKIYTTAGDSYTSPDQYVNI